MKDFIKDYLTFTKKERAGIIIIIILMMSGIILPMLYSKLFPPDDHPMITVDHIENSKDSVSTSLSQDEDEVKGTFYNKTITSYHLFKFDPNTITADEWNRLGVKSKTTHTIENYLQKGGHFYKPEDIRKIYGLRKEDADRLIPYVNIKGKEERKKNVVENTKEITALKKSLFKNIDINKADSAAFCSLPGIGPSYSRRIINFRNKLGGFYASSQVSETYGLPDSTFEKIRDKLIVKDGDVKKININTAPIESLQSHPYIRYKLAKAIVAYRTEHGRFARLEDLKHILLITDEVYEKLQHYLAIE